MSKSEGLENSNFFSILRGRDKFSCRFLDSSGLTLSLQERNRQRERKREGERERGEGEGKERDERVCV